MLHFCAKKKTRSSHHSPITRSYRNPWHFFQNGTLPHPSAEPKNLSPNKLPDLGSKKCSLRELEKKYVYTLHPPKKNCSQINPQRLSLPHFFTPMGSILYSSFGAASSQWRAVSGELWQHFSEVSLGLKNL